MSAQIEGKSRITRENGRAAGKSREEATEMVMDFWDAVVPEGLEGLSRENAFQYHEHPSVQIATKVRDDDGTFEVKFLGELQDYWDNEDVQAWFDLHGFNRGND